ncbi:MAG: heme/copper-type cytochrome/quinol oxidase subunit 3 [Natronomonas sp.]|jgi:heme/copper-type cytochrome/quinol oxidase subunit 3
MVHTSVDAEVQLAVAVVKTLILVVGGSVTYLAYRAYRRTHDESLRLLSVGFGLIVVGVLLAGFTFEILMVDIGVGILIESLFVLMGLSVVAYSLRVQ